MSTTEYIATVYRKNTTSAVTTAHPSMRAAFDWAKATVGSDPDRYARITNGGDLLCHYDPVSTLWFDDGYERWEANR